MKLFTIILSAVFAVVAVPANAQSIGFSASVSYDTVYDSSSGSLTTVSCSDGENGLITQGYTTFGSLPGFPNIGGTSFVEGWNSLNCGTCWRLTYQNTTIYVMAVDHTGLHNGNPAFNIALAAMNALTNNQGVNLGRITVNAGQADPANCS